MKNTFMDNKMSKYQEVESFALHLGVLNYSSLVPANYFLFVLDTLLVSDVGHGLDDIDLNFANYFLLELHMVLARN